MNLKLGTLALLCPACGRGDQFVQADNLSNNTPDDAPVTCLCGVVSRFGALRPIGSIAPTEAETEKAPSLIRDAIRSTLGNQMK